MNDKAETAQSPVAVAPAPLTGNVVRVGMVGAGFMAKTHSLAYSASAMLDGEGIPRAERVRIADVDRAIVERAAGALGWTEATTDWRAITRADDIDVVDIVTPNDAHAEIAIDAARHGKHVICEKPLAPSAEQAREMWEATSAAGVITLVGFVFRTWPAMALARQLIAAERIGKVLSFRGHYFHDYALDRDLVMGWRVQRVRAGAGSVGDLGSHVFDLARLLVGEVATVCARSRTVYPTRPMGGGLPEHVVDVDDATDALVEFENGASGVIQTNWMAAGSKTDIGFEVCGEAGAIRFTWRRNNELELYLHDDPDELQGFRTIYIGPQHAGAQRFWPVAGQGLGYGDAFTILLGCYLRALRAGEQIEPSFRDGLRAAEIVEAAIESSATGTWQEVSRQSG